jgi:phage gp36-like protein
MSYATPANMQARYDARLLGDLVTDSGTAASASAQLTDANLQAALDDASGAIDAALLNGQRYSATDLSGLTGNSQKHLIRMTCDIAIVYLVDRRAYHKMNETLERIMVRAQGFLKQLKDGDNIFDVPAQIAASVPVTTGPTTQTLVNLNSIRRQTRNYYPTEILPGNR